MKIINVGISGTNIAENLYVCGAHSNTKLLLKDSKSSLKYPKIYGKYVF